MQRSSKLLANGLAAIILLGPTPIAAQTGYQSEGGVLIRHSLGETALKRQAAVDRCAASIAAQDIQSAGDLRSIAIIGYDYPIRGGVVVHGTASVRKSLSAGSDELAKSIGFTCDVDGQGNLRRLALN